MEANLEKILNLQLQNSNIQVQIMDEIRNLKRLISEDKKPVIKVSVPEVRKQITSSQRIRMGLELKAMGHKQKLLIENCNNVLRDRGRSGRISASDVSCFFKARKLPEWKVQLLAEEFSRLKSREQFYKKLHEISHVDTEVS